MNILFTNPLVSHYALHMKRKYTAGVTTIILGVLTREWPMQHQARWLRCDSPLSARLQSYCNYGDVVGKLPEWNVAMRG